MASRAAEQELTRRKLDLVGLPDYQARWISTHQWPRRPELVVVPAGFCCRLPAAPPNDDPQHLMRSLDAVLLPSCPCLPLPTPDLVVQGRHAAPRFVASARGAPARDVKSNRGLVVFFITTSPRGTRPSPSRVEPPSFVVFPNYKQLDFQACLCLIVPKPRSFLTPSCLILPTVFFRLHVLQLPVGIHNSLIVPPSDATLEKTSKSPTCRPDASVCCQTRRFFISRSHFIPVILLGPPRVAQVLNFAAASSSQPSFASSIITGLLSVSILPGQQYSCPFFHRRKTRCQNHPLANLYPSSRSTWERLSFTMSPCPDLT